MAFFLDAWDETAWATPRLEDIVVNGTFDADTDWLKGVGASIAAGVLSYDGTQVGNSFTSQISPASFLLDNMHAVYVTVSNRVAGAVRVYLGDEVGPWLDADGTYFVILSPTSGVNFGVEADIDFTGDVDDLIIYPRNTNKVATETQSIKDYWIGQFNRANTQVNGPPSSDNASLDTPRVAAGWSDLGSLEFTFPGDVSGAPWPPTPGPLGSMTIAPSQHTDYHFRIWVIPKTLTLANPTLNVGIPFELWNTFGSFATLNSVLVSGSNVLSFDINPGDFIRDGQLRQTNLFIDAGEATIDAIAAFDFDVGDAQLPIQAVVAETFPILPEVPVTEAWEFRTDIIVNYKGVEQRISLMPQPRVDLDFNVRVVDYEERRILYDLIASNIKVPSLVPMFQYASPVTQTTPIGGTRLYFDPAMTNLRVGKTLVALNRATRAIALGNVVQLFPDGAEINAAVGEAVEGNGLWFVVPAISCFVRDDSGLDFGTQAGTFQLNANAIEDWDLVRPGSTQTVETFDSLPIIDDSKNFLITQPERFAYRRELLDGGVGLREARSKDTNFVVKRTFKFSVDRNTDEMDYWREFFNIVRGAQKSFLCSTQLPDLTIRGGNTVVQGTSTFEINEEYYASKLYSLDAFKRIRVYYENGDSTDHVVSQVTTDAFGVSTLSLLPGLVDDPTYTQINKVSFLHRLRAADKVNLEHYNDYSYIKFGSRTVND